MCLCEAGRGRTNSCGAQRVLVVLCFLFSCCHGLLAACASGDGEEYGEARTDHWARNPLDIPG